jgi:hypothetical protein
LRVRALERWDELAAELEVEDEELQRRLGWAENLTHR